MLVVIPALLAAGGWKAAQAGFALMNRIKRFRLYDAIIGERRVCPVSDIARASGRKPEEVERDLLDMVRRRLFSAGLCGRRDRLPFMPTMPPGRAQNPERARQQDAPLGKEQPRPAPAAQEPVPEDDPAADICGSWSASLHALKTPTSAPRRRGCASTPRISLPG